MPGRILLLGILSLTGYEDWKEQKVSLEILMLGGAAGLVIGTVCKEPGAKEVICGAILGGLVLALALISKEAVGIGDGIILIVSGIILGYRALLELILISLMLTGAAALFLIVVKRKGRTYRLPFIPFLLAAYLLYLAG